MQQLGLPVPLGAEVGWPAGFKVVCLESEASVGLMGAVFGLGVLGVVLVVLGRRVAGERRGGQGLGVMFAGLGKGSW